MQVVFSKHLFLKRYILCSQFPFDMQVEVDLDSVPLIMVTAGSLGVLGALLNTAHGWLSPYRAPSKKGLLRLVIVTFTHWELYYYAFWKRHCYTLKFS